MIISAAGTSAPPPSGTIPALGAGGNGGIGPNVLGVGGNGGIAGPCGGGGGGGAGTAASGGGAGGGACFDVAAVQSIRSGRVIAFVGVATNRSNAQAKAFLDLRGTAKAKVRLQLIGQTTKRGLNIGRYTLSVRYSKKTSRTLRHRRKATVRLRLRLTAPTSNPLSLTRTVTLR